MPKESPYEAYSAEDRAAAESHDTEYGQYSFYEWTHSPSFRAQYKERYKRNFKGITPYEQQSAGHYLRKMDAKSAAKKAVGGSNRE